MKLSEIKAKEELEHQDSLIQNVRMKEREYVLEEYPERDDFQRDYARILYSSAFRRLQGKMQILGIETSAFFRNRLTHSLEVAQIAKGIRMLIDENVFKRKSELSDLFLLDAAALAHDIGHPAFGHKGERVLNSLLNDVDKNLYFEGNAQNYSVLRRLEKKDPTFMGLNLTYRTMLAINKYIVEEGTTNNNGKVVKKFIYKDDFEFLNKFRKENNLLKTRTLDVQIIEIADDIAYAVHDLEDGLSQGYFNIDEILYELNVADNDFTNEERSFASKQMNAIVNDARNIAQKSCSYKNLQEFSQVFRKNLTSKLTHYFMNDIELKEVSEEEAEEHGTIKDSYELKLGESYSLCKILSKKIYKCVTRHPDIAIYESRGAKVIKELFNIYSNPDINKKWQLLPPDYRPITQDDKGDERTYARVASDYIAGMMDTFAIETYERLFNTPFNSICIEDLKLKD